MSHKKDTINNLYHSNWCKTQNQTEQNKQSKRNKTNKTIEINKTNAKRKINESKLQYSEQFGTFNNKFYKKQSITISQSPKDSNNFLI